MKLFPNTLAKAKSFWHCFKSLFFGLVLLIGAGFPYISHKSPHRPDTPTPHTLTHAAPQEDYTAPQEDFPNIDQTLSDQQLQLGSYDIDFLSKVP